MVARPDPDTTLRLTRDFPVACARVFGAFLDADVLRTIWSAPAYTIVKMTVDPRVGGGWSLAMRDEGTGGVGHCRARYTEIKKPSRIVWLVKWQDGPLAGAPEGRVTLEFSSIGGGTRLDLTHEFFPDRRTRDHHAGGWGSGLERLAALLASGAAPRDSLSDRPFATPNAGDRHMNDHATRPATPDGRGDDMTVTLPSDREIRLQRTFDAPRRLVFEAFSKPEHLARWWGWRDHVMAVCEMNFRPGGAYRFVLRAPDGSEYGFRGEYREIVPPARLVQTFEFEGMPGHIATETITFEERDGRTTLTNTVLHATPEDRDGHVQSGMEAGSRESMNRLAELLATME